METEKVTMIRYRGSKVSKIKKIDMFPKLREAYRETSSVGGTFSLVTCIAVLWLLWSEVNFWLESNFEFSYSPDVDFDSKLKIHLDITVAMTCNNLGADILDSTNQNAHKFGELKETPTWFELSPNERLHFDNKKHFNSYLREEYHAIQKLLWQRNFFNIYTPVSQRDHFPKKPYDACRIHGSLELNKVAGNLHITAGKSIHLAGGHVHVSAFMTENEYNFSHRIEKFNFGDLSGGIVHPLEGDEVISSEGMTLYNYFIEVVPTDVKVFMRRIYTYQYSVKSLSRPINHSAGKHGTPGIFFKYDVSALKVTVTQQRDHILILFVRLCSIVAGIYICSGIFKNMVQFSYNFAMCNWNWGIKEENIKNTPLNAANTEVIISEKIEVL